MGGVKSCLGVSEWVNITLKTGLKFEEISKKILSVRF